MKANMNINTLFNKLDEMESLMQDPKWLIGFLYLPEGTRETPEIDLGIVMLHFGFTRAYELFSSYIKKCPDSVGTPNHENITLFFQHLRNIGMTSDNGDPHAISFTPEAEAIYRQIGDGTYPKDVDWNMPVPHHPYQDVSGYRS